MSNKTLVVKSTGELRTLDIPENDVTGYLASVGINPADIAWQSPPAIFLNEVEGAMLALRFHDVTMAEVSDYGPSPVISFRAEAGFEVWSKSGPVEIIPGEEYSMHLFATTLHDQIIELAPNFNELVVIRYCGTRTSGKRTDKDGNAVEYGAYVVVCPERATIKASLSWGDIKTKAKRN